jgi:hypothetical protein
VNAKANPDAGASYRVLQQLTPAQRAIFANYDKPDSAPFLNFGDRAVQIGSGPILPLLMTGTRGTPPRPADARPHTRPAGSAPARHPRAGTPPRNHHPGQPAPPSRSIHSVPKALKWLPSVKQLGTSYRSAENDTQMGRGKWDGVELDEIGQWIPVKPVSAQISGSGRRYMAANFP